MWYVVCSDSGEDRIFVLPSQKIPRYKSTNGQHSSKRRHCLVTRRRLLSRGAVCANVHAYLMY